MEKIYISANDLLLDAFRLAEKIVNSGYRPDFIIGVWRGGAPVGIAIQEYFEYVGITTDHIAIRTSSYTGIEQQDKIVRVHGLDYVIDNVNAEDDVLLVDDVFDSGRSVRAIFDKLQAKCRRNMPQNLKVATPWYKPSKNVTDIKPDYWVNETDAWLVFPHELVGLTQQEILENKGELAKTLSGRLRNAG
jgi:hypoxanthine phosphoribosyltransferase